MNCRTVTQQVFPAQKADSACFGFELSRCFVLWGFPACFHPLVFG